MGESWGCPVQLPIGPKSTHTHKWTQTGANAHGLSGHTCGLLPLKNKERPPSSNPAVTHSTAPDFRCKKHTNGEHTHTHTVTREAVCKAISFSHQKRTIVVSELKNNTMQSPQVTHSVCVCVCVDIMRVKGELPGWELPWVGIWGLGSMQIQPHTQFDLMTGSGLTLTTASIVWC